MADYVSKYTGSQVDGILDEAIELPEATSRDTGKFLKYNGNALEWGPSLDTSNASANEFLKYNGTGNLVWDKPVPDFDSSDLNKALMIVYDNGHPTLKWDVPNPIDISEADDGEFLKYSSTSGIIWDAAPGIDISEADDGDFLKYSGNTGIMWDAVPSIDTTNASNGEFLKYSSTTGIMWDDVPSPLPATSSGGFLKFSENSGMIWTNDLIPESSLIPASDSNGCLLVSNSDGPQWVELNGILPQYDVSQYPSSDAGKVLTVLDNGTLSWVLPNQ